MRVDIKDIVITVAYMIGVNKDVVLKYYGEEYEAILQELSDNKEATIIRYLSKLRSTLFSKFKKTDYEMRYNLSNLDRLEWYDVENIRQLEEWGIPIIQVNYSSEKYMEDFTRLINENIDACESMFQDWIKFEYIRDLFVIPKHTKKNVLKAEFEKYMKYYNNYPFQMYIHWKPRESGNILHNDEKFIGILYSQHQDYFWDKSKVKDATEETKADIYEFIQNGYKVVIVVDCENSDVFKLYGLLRNLKQDEINKIEKIMLYDDCHTPEGWAWLEKFTKIPVEYVQVDRLVEHKSLVDIKMTAGVCTAFYEKNIDSFILCSSDSDFWGLISSLPNANFLVIYERVKCGMPIKEAMEKYNIPNCCMDDFYTGNATDLKRMILLDKLESFAPDIIGKNGKEIARQVYEETRIRYTEAELDNFYGKYIKTMRLKMDEDGVFYVEILT